MAIRNRIDQTSEHDVLDQLFDELWPLCWSITGPGLRKSIELISKEMPLETEVFPSGSRAFDWTVPEEWIIQDARLIGPQGELICDFRASNLSVVNYSEPVDLEIELEDLQKHLHSAPKCPEAIPYVTSYYKKTWGFCLPHRIRERLRPGKYHAWINSEFRKGGVPVAQCLLPGESKREVVLSSYLCHPSMANNELSGPLVLVALYHRLKNWNQRYYSYRFLLHPETIGSLCYLSRYKEKQKEVMFAGLVLTCVGGPSKSLSYKRTRSENHLMDQLFESESRMRPHQIELRPFTPASGSDERQWNSPGIQLPVGQVCRTRYGQYEGYHNSLDTKDFMRIESLIQSVDEIERVLKQLEWTDFFLNRFPNGELQLGRRDLYPNLNAPETRQASTDKTYDGRQLLKSILYVLNYSDGEHSSLWIANRLGCSLTELVPALKILREQGLIERKAGT